MLRTPSLVRIERKPVRTSSGTVVRPEAVPVPGCFRISRGPTLSKVKRSMAGGVQMGPCQVIAGSQCGFLLADGASVLDVLSEVQEPIEVKWAFCLLVPFV